MVIDGNSFALDFVLHKKPEVVTLEVHSSVVKANLVELSHEEIDGLQVNNVVIGRLGGGGDLQRQMPVCGALRMKGLLGDQHADKPHPLLGGSFDIKLVLKLLLTYI